MNSREVKKFLTETFIDCSFSVRTIPCKRKWIVASIDTYWETADGSNCRVIVFKGSFPEDFRKVCIKAVYPDSVTLQAQSSAGNIGIYGITMLPQEWEQTIKRIQQHEKQL